MEPTVSTSHGRVRGVQEQDLSIFRGIPFAAPPIGERRFRAPQPATRWEGVRDATRPGAPCPQPGPVAGSIFGGMFGAMGLETSEDCLSLNVWTPGPDGARRPVLVFIHGGGFRSGTGASPMYDGAALARRGDVVVVTINYRLGALGFLYLPGLTDANAGMLDQVAALEWVQENIAAFGGNPENVTIFGESAGGKGVETLLAMPAARGLFRRAIAQSTYAPPMDAEGAVALGESLLGKLGLTRGDGERLRALPVEEIVQAQVALQGPPSAASGAPTRAFTPTVDGETLPQHPVEAVASGAARDVALIVGTNRDESRLFGMMMPELARLDDEGLARRLAATIPEADGARVGRLVESYRRARQERGEPAAPPDIWFAVSTDRMFRSHSIRLAEAQSGAQPATYMYLFTWPSPAYGGALGSCHALELPFVFGNFSGPLGELAGDGPEARRLSERMMDAWLAFARSGDPNHADLPAWEPFDATARRTMIFDSECALASAPQEEERRLWETVSV